MRGLRIATPDVERAGEGSSDFERLFGFLIPDLPEHRWLIDGCDYDPFAWPADWYGDEARMAWLDSQVEGTPRGIVIDTPFLMSWMGHLTDLDISLFAVPGSDPDWSSWRWHTLAIAAPEFAFQSPTSADPIFRNADGAFWEVFSDRSGLIDSVAARWPKSLPIEMA